MCVGRFTDCHYGETETRLVKRKYEELRSNKTDNEELVDLFRVLPDHDAVEILRRLRGGEDAGALVRQVQAGDLLIQLSLVPKTRRRYEFPYLMDTPAPFSLTWKSYAGPP